MIALILAAGTATRLRPLTNNLPKMLLPIHGPACIIDIQIQTLISHGITRIIIVTGYQHGALTSHLRQRYPDLDFVFIHNDLYEQSGAAYSLSLALPSLTDTCVYLNGDALYDPEILDLVVHAPHPSVTAIQKSAWDEEEVNVITDDTNRVTKLSKDIEEMDSDGEFIGVTKLSREFIAALEQYVIKQGIESMRYHYAIDLLNKIIAQGAQKLYAIDTTIHKAIEIDTEEDLVRARQLFTS